MKLTCRQRKLVIKGKFQLFCKQKNLVSKKTFLYLWPSQCEFLLAQITDSLDLTLHFGQNMLLVTVDAFSKFLQTWNECVPR